MDDNHVDIEMKDFQSGDDFEDPEMLDGVFSSAAVGVGGGEPAGTGGPAEPGDWLRSRLRRQNRLVWIVLVMLTLGSIAYVVSGMYMSEEEVDALVETFESESGVVENGEKNGKYQTALDKAQQNQSQSKDNSIDGIGLVRTGSHWGNGHSNPYANHINGGSNNNNPRGNHHNNSGGGGGFGGHNGLGKLGHKGGGHAGKFGNGGASGGQKLHDDDDNNNENNQGEVINVDEADRDPPPSQPPKSQSDVPPVDPPAVEVDEAEVFCEDLTQYQDWYDAQVTVKDGTMYKVVRKLDHDKNAFTQGLTYARGKLYESTGLYGESTVRILDKDTAEVKKKVDMELRLFGEGMTYYKDKLVQITWKSQQGFVYSLDDLAIVDKFRFTSTKNQGWGITWDRCKDELIVTDGSEYLHFWDPETMSQKRKILVNRLNGKPALELNEIEFWRGRVLANIWFEDVLLVIHPETGVVEKEYDFSALWPKRERKSMGADVFNGISVSSPDKPNQLYVTGKLWDRIYEIELLP